MDELERQRLTKLFTDLLYQYEHRHSLSAINLAYDRKNERDPWVRVAMDCGEPEY